MQHRPMPLVRIPEPFDHPDWFFELKHDGFRALAYVEGHRCRLVSRRGHTFAKWDLLCEEIAHSIKAMRAVLDGELVCLGDDGRALFHRLLYRRDWPSFFAFDLLEVDGRGPPRPALIRPQAPAPADRAAAGFSIALRRPSRTARLRALSRGVRARPGGHRGEVAARPVRARWRVHVLAEDQESRLLADGRPPRTVRVPPQPRPADGAIRHAPVLRLHAT
jgi:hypothetical protein